MPAPISDDKRQQIIDLLPSGKTCNAIAREVNLSNNTVSRVAASVGHQWGHVNVLRAHEANADYGIERRASIQRRVTDELELLLDKLHQPFTAFNFGGRDNTYAEKKLPEPTVDATDKIWQSIERAKRVILDIDTHDNREDAVEAKGLLVRIMESVQDDDG